MAALIENVLQQFVRSAYEPVAVTAAALLLLVIAGVIWKKLRSPGYFVLLASALAMCWHLGLSSFDSQRYFSDTSFLALLLVGVELGLLWEFSRLQKWRKWAALLLAGFFLGVGIAGTVKLFRKTRDTSQEFRIVGSSVREALQGGSRPFFFCFGNQELRYLYYGKIRDFSDFRKFSAPAELYEQLETASVRHDIIVILFQSEKEYEESLPVLRRYFPEPAVFETRKIAARPKRSELLLCRIDNSGAACFGKEPGDVKPLSGPVVWREDFSRLVERSAPRDDSFRAAATDGKLYLDDAWTWPRIHYVGEGRFGFESGGLRFECDTHLELECGFDRPIPLTGPMRFLCRFRGAPTGRIELFFREFDGDGRQLPMSWKGVVLTALDSRERIGVLELPRQLFRPETRSISLRFQLYGAARIQELALLGEKK